MVWRPYNSRILVDAMSEVLAVGDEMQEWKVIHVKRKQNRAAHELAQLARQNRHSALPECLGLRCVHGTR